MASTALQYFSTLCHKLYHIRKKNYRAWSVFWFSLHNLSEIYLILQIIQRYTVINAALPTCTVFVILVRLYWNWNFLSNVRIILKYQISWKSVQWEPSCSRGRTHITKLVVIFFFEILRTRLKTSDLKIVLCDRNTTLWFWTLVWGHSQSIQLHYRKLRPPCNEISQTWYFYK